MSRIFLRDTTGAQDSFQFRVSYDLWCGADTAPPFYAYPGRISNNPHESMEPRCVLPSMRTISAPADCTRPLLGSGRNRYVRILPSGTAERSLFRIVRQKLLYVTYPKLSGPFVEFHKAIFWVGGWDPYSHPRFSNLFRPSYKLSPRAGKETVADVAAVWSHAAEHSHVPAFVRPFVTGRSFLLSPRGSWGQFVRPVGL